MPASGISHVRPQKRRPSRRFIPFFPQRAQQRIRNTLDKLIIDEKDIANKIPKVQKQKKQK